MGGICGFNFESRDLIKQMCDLIAHRGPEKAIYYTDSKISLGERISNLNRNISLNQLIHNEDNNLWLILDGEIFNNYELKIELESKGHIFNTNNNSEVFIHAYEEWATNCFDKFRGVFAFCLFDMKKNILILVRDHLGIKPLYYYYDGKNFVFSSEIKSILCHDIKRNVDKRALNMFLSLKYVPFKLTLFQDIYRLPSSSYLVFNLKEKKFKISQYNEYNFNINYSKSEVQLINELKNLIIDSIKIRLIKDIPIGVFLSGGIDSSSVVGVLSSLMSEPILTFSIEFEEGAPVNETKYAKMVSEFNKTEHTKYIIKSDFYSEIPTIAWINDDLFSDAAIIPLYLLGKKVKDRTNLIFTGDGADEVFAGYSVYYRTQPFNYLNKLPKKTLSILMRMYNYVPSYIIRRYFAYINQSQSMEDRYLRAICSIPDEEKIRIFPFKTESLIPMIKKTFIQGLDVVNQFTHWDLKYQLPSQYNIKADRAISATSLTARIPFLDRDIVKWSLTIPSNLKLNAGVEKYILRMAMKEYLPIQVLKRKKLGFGTPFNFWLRNGLNQISDTILENLEKRKDYFNPYFIKKIKRNKSNKYYQGIAWRLIMFELWYETFIENSDLKPIRISKL